MKLSFTTLGCPDWELERIVAVAKELKFDGVEIRGLGGKIPAGEIEAFQPENREKTKNLFAQNQLEICGFGSSVCFHDAAEYDKMLEEGKRTIDICAAMGIPHIRVFGDRIPEGSCLETLQQQVIHGLRALCAYAADKPVDILLENHRDFNSVETMEPIVEAMKTEPKYGILWDIAASDTVYTDDYRTFYQMVKDSLRFVHVKDHKRTAEGFQLCSIGQGDIPIADIVHMLYTDEYDGYLSFEWEKRWHPELPDASESFHEFMKYMKRLPEFSEKSNDLASAKTGR